MKVVIIDDEKSMLLIMKKMLSKVDGVEVSGIFQNTGEAYKFIKENSIDIAFVDIKMPDESGLDFARKMMEEYKGINLVFITSYRKYAIDAFDVNAVDYIVKPVTQERLERALNKITQNRLPSRTENFGGLPAKLSVYCLGGMEIKDTNNISVRLNSAKSYELLAFLVLHKGRFISKWNVIEDIFGEMPVANAETYLNTTIYKLRKSLEQCGMKEAVITANESYRIDVKYIYTDFTDFENKVKELKAIDESNIEKAIAAESLFSGQLFGDKEYLWSMHEKERLTDLYWDLAKKIGCFLLNDNVPEALQILKKMVKINELDEEVNCLLMKGYAAKRDLVSLVRQFNKYTKVLRNELKITPGKYVYELYSSLKKSIDKLEAN